MTDKSKLTTEIPSSLHKKIKARAKKEKTSQAEVVRKALAAYVKG